MAQLEPIGCAGDDSRQSGFVKAVIRDYDAPLRKYLRRKLRSKEDVDDIIQEIYLRLFRYCQDREVEKPEAFIFSIARNILRDRARSQRNLHGVAHIPVDSVDLESEEADPEQTVQSRQEWQLFTEALSELNGNCRRAFVLHRFSGMKYREISAEMGVSVAMIEHHIMQALAHLRRRLGKLK